MCVFLPDSQETVSSRVEQEVTYEMFNRRHLHYNIEDARKKESVEWYINWLTREHASRCSALREAVHRNFAVREDDEFVTQTLREAYKDLQQSKDPAVRYYLQTLSYLLKGSQQRHPDAISEVEWINESKTMGKVVTPAGTLLGIIEKYADGAWGISSPRRGSGQIKDAAETVADAKAYLVNCLTRQVGVTVNGESKQRRILNERDFFTGIVWSRNRETSMEMSRQALTHELEFWDGQHGLSVAEEVSVVLQPEGGSRLVSVLEGTVIAVEEQKVSIAGT